LATPAARPVDLARIRHCRLRHDGGRLKKVAEPRPRIRGAMTRSKCRRRRLFWDGLARAWQAGGDARHSGWRDDRGRSDPGAGALGALSATAGAPIGIAAIPKKPGPAGPAVCRAFLSGSCSMASLISSREGLVDKAGSKGAWGSGCTGRSTAVLGELEAGRDHTRPPRRAVRPSWPRPGSRPALMPGLRERGYRGVPPMASGRCSRPGLRRGGIHFDVSNWRLLIARFRGEPRRWR
jgi:hypothetical protein